MYISNVIIKNFRGIKKLSLPLNEGVNILVGENNLGKTAIIDAIRIVLGNNSTAGERIWITKEDLHHTGVDSFEKTIRIDLEFSGLSTSEMGLFVEALNYNKEYPKKSTISIHYEWSWDKNKERYSIKRWGGDREQAKAVIDEFALQTLKWTYLSALRDAIIGLEPGRNSRIAKLICALSSDDDKEKILNIFNAANTELSKASIIKYTHKSIDELLKKKLGDKLSQKINLQASDYSFEGVVRNLRLVINGLYESDNNGEKAIDQFSLHQNGLGYNNLLYIATVIAELEASRNANYRVLLLEEPEAHLHPHLQIKLADYFLEKLGTPNTKRIVSSNEKEEPESDSKEVALQLIVTSHSPVIASRVPAKRLKIIHKDSTSQLKVAQLDINSSSPVETAAIQRMLNITRGVMFFARGIVFVEGVTEELLVPILAKNNDINLEDHAISIIPVNGVDFKTLCKFFGRHEHGFDIPVSIITDSDPKKIIESGDPFNQKNHVRNQALPEKSKEGKTIACDRVKSLMEYCEKLDNVSVFMSEVTLEYDLAKVGEDNITMILETVRELYKKSSECFSNEKINEYNNTEEKALYIWQEICLGKKTFTKASFAHQLAYNLQDKNKQFITPKYILDAIKHACKIKD